MTEIPHAQRFWWLKRLSIAGLFLLLILFALRLWWGHVALIKLDSQIAVAQARGEPVLIDDFNELNSNLLPDAKNAAAQLIKASINLNYNAAQTAFDNRFNADFALSAADRKLLDGLIVANAKTISLLRVAADLPQESWGLKVQSPMINVLLPALNWQRRLANLLVYAAIDHHLLGNDAQTVEDQRDIFRESDIAEQYGPFIVTHLVAIGISTLGADSIAHLAGTLSIDSTTNPAVRQLIAQILDERAYKTGGQRSWYGERLIAIDDKGTLSFISPTPKNYLLWPVSPMLTLDQVRIFQYDTTIAHALSEPTYPAALLKLPTYPSKSNFPPLQTASRIYTMLLMPSVDRAVLTHYRGLAERRAAAVLLAIRLYQVDHGAAPANLNLLVPTYLPAVPIDPFSPTAGPLRYINTPGAETVYSVGEDGRDDGGSTQLIRAYSGPSHSHWDTKDAVYTLHHPPATRPVSGN
jgi:hypothetical protein